MKIGLSTWSLLGLDVVSAVRRIGDAGFDYIELWGDLPHAYPGWVDAVRLKDVLSSYKMTVTMHAPFADLNPANPIQPVKGAVEKALEAFVDFSSSLGASVVTVHPGSVHNESMVSGSMESSLSTIHGMMKAAAGRLSISVENQANGDSKYHYPLATTPESVRTYLDSAEGLRFTLDTGHAHASGQDPTLFAEKTGSRLVEVHLSDNSGSADDHLVPGEGSADLQKLLGMLKGREVLVCLEINPHRYSPTEVLRASASFKTHV